MVLEPRVARIEVVGFEYKAEVDDATQAEKERLYESIQVEQIVLNNYYGQAEFVTGAVSGIKTNTPIDAGSVFGFFANAASDWTNDKLDGTNLPGSQSGRGGGLQDGVRGCRQTPGLPFLPDAAKIAGDDHPQLVVKLTGTKANGDKAALYLATKGFACRDLRRCQDLSGEIRIRRRRSGESAEMRRGQRGCRCLGCRTGHRPALRFFHRHFHGEGRGRSASSSVLLRTKNIRTMRFRIFALGLLLAGAAASYPGGHEPVPQCARTGAELPGDGRPRYSAIRSAGSRCMFSMR